jgi:hypothetical protein
VLELYGLVSVARLIAVAQVSPVCAKTMAGVNNDADTVSKSVALALVMLNDMFFNVEKKLPFFKKKERN